VSEEPTPAVADVSAPSDSTDTTPSSAAEPSSEAPLDNPGLDNPGLDNPGPDNPGPDNPGPDSPWNDPRLPWEGKPRRVDILCWAAITLSGVYYLCLLPFRATLVGTHPLVLVVLNGATEGIVSAAASARVHHGSLVWVLVASVPGLMKFDFIYWWAGRLWGERIILLFSGRRKHGAKFMVRVQRWGAWFTWPAVVVSPFLPIPNAIVYAVAGWAGMNLATFLVLDAIGSLAWAGMLTWLGYALGQHAVSVAQAVSRYGLWISIGIVVLVFVSQMRGMRAQS
jgi:membrane-associated protein